MKMSRKPYQTQQNNVCRRNKQLFGKCWHEKFLFSTCMRFLFKFRLSHLSFAWNKNHSFSQGLGLLEKTDHAFWWTSNFGRTKTEIFGNFLKFFSGKKSFLIAREPKQSHVYIIVLVVVILTSFLRLQLARKQSSQTCRDQSYVFCMDRRIAEEKFRCRKSEDFVLFRPEQTNKL